MAELNKDLVEKIQSAALDMMSKVIFEKNGHTYKRISDGKWLQGVSEVSSIVPKDWLSAWGAKEAVKALGYSDYEGDTALAEEVLEKIARFHEKKDFKGFIRLLKEAKGASRRKSKTALVDGTAGHKWLETFLKAEIRIRK